MRKRMGTARSLFTLGVLAALGALTLGGVPAGAVELHPLTVTATTSISCSWTVDKQGPGHLTLAVDEVFAVNYTVIVTKTCSNSVSGTISGGGNPLSVTATAGAATGVVSGCAYSAGTDSFSCNLVANPATTADGTVQAMADYGGGNSASGSTPYSFVGAPVSEESVDVVDLYGGVETPLAVHLNHSETFHYSRNVSFHGCGHFTVENTAIVRDGEELDRDTVSISVDVPCHGVGCTLTQGYWKTRSKYGPAAKPDATWNLLPGGLGPDTVFFLSGQSWIQVFNTPPAGNVYYQLAHQYMAARLNILNGASSTAAVNAAISGAATFFNTYTPAQAGALAKDSTARKNALAWAATLGSYNEGAVGPGHCDE